jgi:hypothetical protein
MGFALLAGHCYSMIGEVTLMTGAKSYQDGWAKSIDPNTAWLPGLVVLSQTLVACVCYSIIIGDLGYDLFRGMTAQPFSLTIAQPFPLHPGILTPDPETQNPETSSPATTRLCLTTAEALSSNP